jgi:uncharacterized protein
MGIDKIPEDLELVLKSSVVELRAKNFDWRKPAEKLEALLKLGNPKTLLLIDELPLLIGSIVQEDPSGRRAERFLLWLKRIREQYSPRWFFAGSIGLDSVARRLKLSGTIHDLQPIELGAFNDENARAFLVGRALTYNWILSAETIDSILEAVEWPIPYYLNLVFEELRVAVSEGRGDPSPQLVEVALQRLLTHRAHFDHWDERLAKMLDVRAQQFCDVILALACRDAGGVRVETIDLRLSKDINNESERADMVGELLDLLTSDGYLVRHQGAVSFRSALLRRYWLEVQA